MSLGELYDTAEQLHENGWQDKKFFASLQGVNLDEVAPGGGTKEREVMERIVAKANAVLNGNSGEDPEAIERQRFADMGIDYEVI